MGSSPALALKIYFEVVPEQYSQWEMVFGIQEPFHNSTKKLDSLQIKNNKNKNLSENVKGGYGHMTQVTGIWNVC